MHRIENPDTFRTNVRSKINLILHNEKNSNNLEKGIFNYALKEADQRKVVKKWDNAAFVHIYTSHLRSIYMNLNIVSSTTIRSCHVMIGRALIRNGFLKFIQKKFI